MRLKHLPWELRHIVYEYYDTYRENLKKID